MELNDSRIIITGAARGLGQAMAANLARAGARLGLIDLDDAALSRTVGELPGSGHDWAVANVADEAAVVAAFDQFAGSLDRVDALINNAGITRDGLLVKARDGRIESRLSLEQWRQVMDVNLTGVFLCGREAATRMIGGGTGGVIINIASISKAGNFGQSNYSAAKAGVAAMAVTWSGLQRKPRNGRPARERNVSAPICIGSSLDRALSSSYGHVVKTAAPASFRLRFHLREIPDDEHETSFRRSSGGDAHANDGYRLAVVRGMCQRYPCPGCAGECRPGSRRLRARTG